MKAPTARQIDVSILDHLGSEPGVVEIYMYANLVVCVWLDSATSSAVDRLVAAGRYVTELGTPMVGIVHWLTPNRPMPDPELRERLVRSIRAAFPPFAYSALILNGKGFWASAIRATLNGMRLLVPNKVDMRLEATIEDVAVWLPDVHEARTGVRIRADEVIEVVNDAASRARDTRS